MEGHARDRARPAGQRAAHPAVRALAWIWTRLPNDRVRSRIMWWLNARFAVGVTGIVRNERGEVLFVEHAFRRRYPWALPGGWIGQREQLPEALIRELREETGLEVEPDRFLGAWIDWYTDGARDGATSTLNLYWTARVVSGRPEAADDVSELRWFAPDELPAPDTLAFANVARVIDAWREEHA